MARAGLTQGDHHVAGALTCQSFTPPAGCITNAAVQAGTNVDATKLEHQHHVITQLFAPTATVTALTETIYFAYGAADLVEFGAWIEVVATGADRTVTVDLHKSSGGGAYATILSATVGFTNLSTVRVKVTGTFSSATLVAGDILRVVVTVAGAAGAQATGLATRLVLREEPD